jgi:hypothetical protein
MHRSPPPRRCLPTSNLYPMVHDPNLLQIFLNMGGLGPVIRRQPGCDISVKVARMTFHPLVLRRLSCLRRFYWKALDMDDVLRGYKGDVDTTLAPRKRNAVQYMASQRSESGLDPRSLRTCANPLQRMNYHS